MALMEDDDRMHMLASEDDRPPLLSLRTQHGLTKSEIVQGMANRFMYSRYYIALYIGLALLSLVTIVMSIKETCPSLLFIIFEAIINLAMIIEVTVRLLALRRAYWHSVWNIIDIVLVGLCAITLVVLATGCSVGERSEAIFDTVLLVIRNSFQVFRLFMMIRKNQYSLNARSTRVDFDALPDYGRDPSVEFSAFDRGLDESFLEDEDSDVEHGR
ncbi:uncharacterized protein BYT42DRAFT_593008 [Radiomyces spectabilis]|uniref:uncharacterized protein n=1 Tax=Radiomyces spectabilis TaxID=64574 RepID=UPI00221E50CF|nr:uncharacterized protein BYT42DRAFT_593008 [Radiomyces spectabilis]KAI8380901.1 hypothetical protein BYT42DRAFT_593008 [Radiomyces spectabilis]